jgi:FkbM family methyltransferase
MMKGSERSLRRSRALDFARRNRRLLWQRTVIRVRRPPPPSTSRELRRIGDVQFEFDFDLGSIVEMMHRGDYAPELVSLLPRLLHPGDVVIDVGANIGYISAVALSVVGPIGAVHAFEPVTRYYERLRRLSDLNPDYRLWAHRLALSDHEGVETISISDVNNIGWNTMVPGYIPPEETEAVETTSTIRLDAYLEFNNVTPALIKIDVEGFELPVLRGLERHIRAGHHPLIVCELAPSAYARVGATVEDLATWLIEIGYMACDVVGLDPLDVRSVDDTRDVLFVPADKIYKGDRWARRRLDRALKHAPRRT